MDIILTREELLDACCRSKNKIDAKAARMIKDGKIQQGNKTQNLSCFMLAVLDGDSKSAFDRADLYNRIALYEYVVDLIQRHEIDRIKMLLHHASEAIKPQDDDSEEGGDS